MSEDVVGGTILIVVGLGVLWVGWLGATRRIDFAMGGHTKEKSTPESWDVAHVVAGKGLAGSGVLMALAGLLIAWGRELAGVVVAALSVVVMMVQVVRGVIRIESRS